MDIYVSILFTWQPALLPDSMSQLGAVLLYFGPETIMPVGSFLAAVLGMFLIFWRQTVAVARSSFRRVFVRKSGYSRFNSDRQVSGPGQERGTDMTD